jgi:phosphopentomutase
VARVIARPFEGAPGRFTRTAQRKDFSLPPAGPTLLDALQDAGFETLGVGKIHDIFSGRGLTDSHPTKDNAAGIQVLIDLKARAWEGLAFANLIDFDMRYGHRNDAAGFAAALEAFDLALPGLLDLDEGDLLVLTADHGCDPAHPGTDHTREFVPVLCLHPGSTAVNLGDRDTFADLGQTIARNFGITLAQGSDFLDALAPTPGRSRPCPG